MTARKLEMSLDELIAASKTVDRPASKRLFERAPPGDWRGGRRRRPAIPYYYCCDRRGGGYSGGRSSCPIGQYNRSPIGQYEECPECCYTEELSSKQQQSERSSYSPQSRSRDFSMRRRSTQRGVTLRVMGLDYAVLESELLELFSAVGEVTKCWIHYDRTDRSLGTGGVTFANPEAAEEARRRYDGRVLDGKTLRLSYV